MDTTTGFPLEPILTRLPGHLRPSSDDHAKVLRVPVRVWRTMRQTGVVPAEYADQVAVGVGEHPAYVWRGQWRHYEGVV